MHIAVVGATGELGRRVAVEALGRGHRVTGFSRTGRPRPGVDESATTVTLAALDAGDPEAVAAVAAQNQLVTGCTRPPHDAAGQSAALCRAVGAAELTRELAAGCAAR